MRRMRRPTAGGLAILALGVVVLAVFLGAEARLIPYLADDAFISLRYAQHLVQGHGLVYNVGERVEGYTNFLWTAVLALPFVLRLNPMLFVKFTSVALTLGSAALVSPLGIAARLLPAGFGASEPDAAPQGGPRPRKQRRAQHATPAAAPLPTHDRALTWVPALLFLATPAVILAAADGLETPMFVFLLLLALVWFFEEREGRGFPRSALALAALAMTRPDGIPFGLFLLGVAAI